MQTKLKMIILFLCSVLLRFFIIRDPNVLIFSARGGRGFEGYAKCLFDYAHHNTKYNCIWIAKDKIVVQKIREQGFNAYYFFTLGALHSSLVAKAVFITHSITDAMPIWFNKNTIVIDLWHGTPIKKIGFFDQNQSLLAKCIAWVKSKRVNYVICPAEELKDIYSKALNIPTQNVIVAGNLASEYLRKQENISKINFKNRIIYCPTFRDYEYENPFLHEDYLTELDRKLCKINKTMDIKLHPQEVIRNNYTNFSHIKFISQDFDIYSILHNYEGLVTDYSSVIFDFATAFPERKFAFVADDITRYSNSRGFVLNYHDLVKLAGFADLLECVCSSDRKVQKQIYAQNDIAVYDRVLGLIRD